MCFSQIGGSALTDDIAIEMREQGLPTTFVPGRNLMFLTAAAALGYRRGIRDLVGGMCETDYSGYPDCRDATMTAMEQALELGFAQPFVIHTPLMFIDKAETWRLAERLGGARAHRTDRRGNRHLLSRRPHASPRLGLWLRRMPGVRAARSGLRALSRDGRMTYSVKEIYYTLQGEGAQTGRAAVFLRFAGCNLWSGREEDRAIAPPANSATPISSAPMDPAAASSRPPMHWPTPSHRNGREARAPSPMSSAPAASRCCRSTRP